MPLVAGEVAHIIFSATEGYEASPLRYVPYHAIGGGGREVILLPTSRCFYCILYFPIHIGFCFPCGEEGKGPTTGKILVVEWGWDSSALHLG